MVDLSFHTSAISIFFDDFYQFINCIFKYHPFLPFEFGPVMLHLQFVGDFFELVNFFLYVTDVFAFFEVLVVGFEGGQLFLNLGVDLHELLVEQIGLF